MLRFRYGSSRLFAKRSLNLRFRPNYSQMASDPDCVRVLCIQSHVVHGYVVSWLHASMP